MHHPIDRRQVLKLAGPGGIVFASTPGSRRAYHAEAQAADDFDFVQLCDSHRGVSTLGSQPRRDPLPWDPAEPCPDLGFRDVEAELETAEYELTELPIKAA